MAKEIKKGSREAKKIFEQYKKRLESGEELYGEWLDDKDILTNEQIEILSELDCANIEKTNKELDEYNELLKDLIKDMSETSKILKTGEEYEEELFQDFLKSIQDLSKEDQEKEIQSYKAWRELDKKIEANHKLLQESRAEEDEKISKMTKEEFDKYVEEKFKRGREYIKSAKFDSVKILESNLPDDKD